MCHSAHPAGQPPGGTSFEASKPRRLTTTNASHVLQTPKQPRGHFSSLALGPDLETLSIQSVKHEQVTLKTPPEATREGSRVPSLREGGQRTFVDVSISRQPARNKGLLATMPTGCPSILAKPTVMFLAHSGMISKYVSSSTT